MRPKSGIEAPDEDPDRAPKPGVAGSNPAGGTQNSGPLTRRSGASPSICRVRGVRFHCTKAAPGLAARILLMPTGPKMPLRPWTIGHWCKTDSPGIDRPDVSLGGLTGHAPVVELLAPAQSGVWRRLAVPVAMTAGIRRSLYGHRDLVRRSQCSSRCAATGTLRAPPILLRTEVLEPLHCHHQRHWVIPGPRMSGCLARAANRSRWPHGPHAR
jgi:hypothetical protein